MSGRKRKARAPVEKEESESSEEESEESEEESDSEEDSDDDEEEEDSEEEDSEEEEEEEEVKIVVVEDVVVPPEPIRKPRTVPTVQPGSQQQLGHEDLKLVLGMRELSNGTHLYYPIKDNFREVHFDFHLKEQDQIPQRNKDAMAKRHERILQTGMNRLDKAEDKEEKILERAWKRAVTAQNKRARKRDRVGRIRRPSGGKRKPKKRGKGKSAIQHDMKNKVLELEMSEYPEEFEPKRMVQQYDASSHASSSSSSSSSSASSSSSSASTSSTSPAAAAPTMVSSLPLLPRPSHANTFRGTSFFGVEEDTTKLMSLYNSLSMFEEHFEDLSIVDQHLFDRRHIFPPKITPVHLAMYLEHDRPTFTTVHSSSLYRGTMNDISPFDRIMIILVRAAWRDMLNRLSTLDSSNQMNRPTYDRTLGVNVFTSEKSLYWFSEGPETINDLSWPEYARRILVAYDMERDSKDLADIVSGLRGETCSTSQETSQLYLQHMGSHMASKRDKDYLPSSWHEKGSGGGSSSSKNGRKKGSSSSSSSTAAECEQDVWLGYEEDTPLGKNSPSFLMHRCVYLIEHLMSSNDAAPFSLPVDLNIFPSYPDFVKYPIDFTTIRSRLMSNSHYETVHQFAMDVRLVWANCSAFNNHDSDINVVAILFSKVFEICLTNFVLSHERVVWEDYGSPRQVFEEILARQRARPWNPLLPLSLRHPAFAGRSSKRLFSDPRVSGVDEP